MSDLQTYLERITRRVCKDGGVILSTGGADSTTLAYAFKHLGMPFNMFFFDYGHGGAKQQWELVQIHASLLGVPMYRHVWDTSLAIANWSVLKGVDFPELKYDKKEDFWETYGWVEGRNIFMNSYAALYAAAKGFAEIYVGLSKDDRCMPTDQNKEFFEGMNKAFKWGFLNKSKGMKVIWPMIEFELWEIIHLGKLLGLDFDLTSSCDRADVPGCGKCHNCNVRVTRFYKYERKKG